MAYMAWPRVLAIMGAQLFAYGVVWIVKFLVFNRIIFADQDLGAARQCRCRGRCGPWPAGQRGRRPLAAVRRPVRLAAASAQRFA